MRKLKFSEVKYFLPHITQLGCQSRTIRLQGHPLLLNHTASWAPLLTTSQSLSFLYLLTYSGNISSITWEIPDWDEWCRHSFCLKGTPGPVVKVDIQQMKAHRPTFKDSKCHRERGECREGLHWLRWSEKASLRSRLDERA